MPMPVVAVMRIVGIQVPVAVAVDGRTTIPGISSLDLEAAAEGDLIGNMLQALDDAEFRRMYRDQVADQE